MQNIFAFVVVVVVAVVVVAARFPQFLNLTTSKTQQFWESSSIFELDNVKNETKLREFLNS